MGVRLLRKYKINVNCIISSRYSTIILLLDSKQVYKTFIKDNLFKCVLNNIALYYIVIKSK